MRNRREDGPKRKDSPCPPRREEPRAEATEPRPKAPAQLKAGEIYTCRFQGAARGGFAMPETPGLSDIFIDFRNSGDALHGDQVRVRVLKGTTGRLPEGEVERVLRHANKQIVGQFRRSGRDGVVTPRNAKIRRLVKIPRIVKGEEIADGTWVVAEIKSWSQSPDEPLVGRVTEILGTDADRRLPILLLIRQDGIVPEFPPEVVEEAKALHGRGISQEEIGRRRDFRGDAVMTIDPATAKDFDDAISLVEKLDDGWRVAVHIADVAHYVRPDTAIDAEAFDRATSIYPVDRVVPMLPEELSNDLCSLKPGVDRLSMTAVFNVNSRGEVSGVELCESVICSARRFAYEEVQGFLDSVDKLEPPRFPRPVMPPAVEHDLLQLRLAGRALMAARMKRGSLDLDLPETEILFDAEGIVSDVRRKERLESHRLIEDFMIAANEAVAREMARRKIPILYRVHAPPDEEKLDKLAPAFNRFGLQFPKSGGINQDALQRALTKAQEHPAGAIVQRLVLRSMKRAVYQPENIGHFGLASACYTHFTSPIRRYPDTLVHRAVKTALRSGDAAPGEMEKIAPMLVEWGRHTSDREARAQKIEWDAQKILTLEFMKKFTGDIFEGFIGGMTQRGFFVELVQYPAEGFVPLKSIQGDYYDLDEAGMAMHGRSTGIVYALGDKVSVQIERIDVLAGEMDFSLVRKEGKASDLAPPREKVGKAGWQARAAKAAQPGKGPKPFTEKQGKARGKTNKKDEWKKHFKKK